MRRGITLILTAMILSVLMLSGICRVAGAEPVPEGQAEQKTEELELHAQSAVLMDAESGRVLYGKNELQIRPMASTTKIMTCILALELGDPDDVVTASAKAAGQPKVHLGVQKGETIYLKDLLYSLMLESHNDAAVMIAEHIGGSVEGFAALMNQKAGEIGCYDTCFITPNGLDAEIRDEEGKARTHSTTAGDLAGIMRYCVMKSPKRQEFLEITRAQNHYFTDTDGRRSFSCVNHNAFLSMMDGALSGKTGFTGGAGYSYIGALRDGDRTFIVALLGCGWPPHKTWKWEDTRKLFTYGLKNYQYRDVFEERTFQPVKVRDGIPAGRDLGDEASTKLTMKLKQDEGSLKLLMREDEQVSVKEEVPAELTAPVRAGDAVGSISYYLEGQMVKSYPVYACVDVDRIGFAWCLKRAAEAYLPFSVP